MKTLDDYRVIKINGNEDVNYAIVLVSDITDGNLIDAYHSSLSCSHAEIGDYSWGQCNFNQDMKKALAEHLGIDSKLEGLVIEEDNLAVHTYDSDEEEMLESLIADKGDEIRRFCDKWAESNESLVRAKYINYWDGSNHQSIILWDEIEDNNEQYELLDKDDDKAVSIIREYLNSERVNEVDKFHYNAFDTESYNFKISHGDDWSIADVKEI